LKIEGRERKIERESEFKEKGNERVVWCADAVSFLRGLQKILFIRKIL